MPVSLTSAHIALSRMCNSRCLYCGIWKERLPGPTCGRLAGVLDQLADNGVKSVSFTGGEPLLRQDLEAILEHATKLGMQTSLATNGILLTDDRLASILDSGLTTLVVSLDSVDPGIYERLRGRPLAPVIESVLRARQRISSPRGLAVSAVMTSLSLPELPRLAAWCSTNSVPLSLQPLHGVWGAEEDGSELASLRLDPHDAERVRNTISVVKASGACPNNAEYLEALSEFSIGREVVTRTTCTTGRTSIVVYWDLGISPCWNLPRLDWGEGIPLKTMLQQDAYRTLAAQAEALDCPRCWLACYHDM